MTTPLDDPKLCVRCGLSLAEQPDGAYRLYRTRGGAAICVSCTPLAFGEEATSNLRLPAPARGWVGTNVRTYTTVRAIGGVLRWESDR